MAADPVIEAAPRAVERERFRRGLGRWATGVALVTARIGGQPEGMIVNSLTAVSYEPPLIAFCPSRMSLTWCRMRAAERFGINVLGVDDVEFAASAAVAGADRFEGIDWAPTANGVPALEGALAFLECAMEAVHPAGDHWIVVGRVEAMELGADAGADGPLVHWRGRYRELAAG
jgi:flavin reductase (DIM6/NTAB) family NADH-FMN oxidoreductase RutF